MHHNVCHYPKEEIKHYMNRKWFQTVKSKHPHLNIECWEKDLYNKDIFPKGSSRLQNTQTSEFIHGHSIRFNNFRKSIPISVNFVPLWKTRKNISYLNAPYLSVRKGKSCYRSWKIILQTLHGKSPYQHQCPMIMVAIRYQSSKNWSTT